MNARRNRRITLQVSVALLLLAGAFGIAPRAQVAARYDLLFRGGRVVDGTGAPWVRADVAVKGDTIVLVAPRIDAAAARVVDAAGLVVSPGFIDIHTHARRGIFAVPTADNYTRQGVTTIYEGPDGSSPLPIKDFLAKVAATKVSPNFGTFVGQGSVREAVIGTVNREATPAEIETMRGLVRQGMLDGAVGLSTGLFYVPGIFTPTEEVIELAKVAGAMGGIHVSHMRNEAAGVLDSVRETIAIGEQGHLPTQVTHHKIIGVQNWGRSIDTLKLLYEARARGVDGTIDQYPYTASATSMSALFPPWALEGGRQDIVKRLQDQAARAKIKATVVENIKFDRGGGDPKNVSVSSCTWDPSLAGKNLADITRGRGMEPTIENAAETAMYIIEKGGAQGIFHAIDEKDLVRIITCPLTMIASDGEVPIFGQAAPHPRSYGTFARVLAVYVHDKGLLSLEEGVRKMTSLPAQAFGLKNKGLIKTGRDADLVIFDPARIQDGATFEEPLAPPEGVEFVLVHGQLAVEEGRITGERAGVVQRRSS